MVSVSEKLAPTSSSSLFSVNVVPGSSHISLWGSYAGLHTVRRTSLFLFVVRLCLLGPGANSLCPLRKAPPLSGTCTCDRLETFLPVTVPSWKCMQNYFITHFQESTPHPQQTNTSKNFQHQKHVHQSSYPSFHQVLANPNLDSGWLPAHLRKVTACESLLFLTQLKSMC